MKPRTKLQKLVVGLSEKLPKLTSEQMEWGIKECIPNFYTISRKTHFCLECGHSWKLPNTKNIPEYLTKKYPKVTCPECNLSLKIGNNKTYFDYEDYCAVLTTVNGWQVVRMILVRKWLRKSQKPESYSSEVMQHFIHPDGSIISLSIGIQSMTSQADAWNYGTELEVRGNKDMDRVRFNIYASKVYPKQKVLPIIRRNGYKSNCHDLAPHWLFAVLLTYPKAETLFKARQYNLITGISLGYKTHRIDDYWSSVKVCMRNNYIVKDASMWVDYINLLNHFKKDVRNAFYICPENLKKAHDILDNKQKVQEKIERDLRQAEWEANAPQRKLENERKSKEKIQLFYEMKNRYFNLVFKSNKISIQPLKTVKEFLEEGEAMDHCVHSSEYFNRDESLVLSARVNGERAETMEVCLKEFKILQSRGINNEDSKYHNQIVKLMERNMPKLMAC